MTTEIFNLDKEIKILCVTPTSFPDGIMGAGNDGESLRSVNRNNFKIN